MTQEELLTLLKGFEQSVNSIEKTLKMPSGTLAKATTGKRNLPEKWIPILTNYVNENRIDRIVLQPAAQTEEAEQEPLAETIELPKEEEKDNTPEWAQKVVAFCNTHNITPDDLMAKYLEKASKVKTHKRPDAALTELVPDKKKKDEPEESYFERRQREKNGM